MIRNSSDKLTFMHNSISRYKLFKTVLSVRKGRMVTYSIITFLPWLPAILWSAINLLHVLPVITSEVIEFETLLNIAFFYFLILAPLIAITGPFNAASSYVMRNWARDEHADLSSDYRFALKNNWKQGIMFSTTDGLMIFLFFNADAAYFARMNVSPLFCIPISIIIITRLVWRLCYILIPTIMVTYQLNILNILQNAIILSCIHFLHSAGILVLTLIIPIAGFVVCCFNIYLIVWVAPILIIYMALFGIGLNKLVYASYANAICAKYIDSKL